MSVTIDKHAVALVAGLAFVAVALAMLPDMAAAQDDTPVQATPNANRSTPDNVSGVSIRTSPEAAEGRWVVSPGDNLWTISQYRLGPEATPGQVLNEVQRVYQLNRTTIGEDPNLISTGQELVLFSPTGVSEAASEAAPSSAPGTGPAAAPEQQVSEEPSPEAGSAMAPEEQEALPQEEEAAPVAAPDDPERRLLGTRVMTVALVLILLFAVLLVFLAWRLPVEKYGKQAVQKVQGGSGSSTASEKKAVGSSKE